MNLKQAMMTAAGLTLAAAAAWSQTATMKATVPFEFRVGGKHMAAGVYEIRGATSRMGAPVLKMTNEKSGEVAILMARFPVSAKKGQAAELQFACAQGQCVVEKIFEGGHDGWAFEPAGGNKGETVFQASIPLERPLAR